MLDDKNMNDRPTDDYDAMLAEMEGQVEAMPADDYSAGNVSFGGTRDATPVAAPSEIDDYHADEILLEELKAQLQFRKDMKGDFAGWQPSLYNLRRILTLDPKTAGSLAYNEMTARPVFMRDVELAEDLDPVRTNGAATLPISDHHAEDIRSWLSGPEDRRGWGINAKLDDVRQSISSTARTNRFHPVKQLYEAETWDGVSRIDSLYTRYLGTKDDVYHREASRLLMLAMCARIYEPGCDFQYMTVLQGVTGSGKSTFIKTLGGEHYGEVEASSMKTLEKKTEAMVGPHVIEMPELTALAALPVDEAKQLISRGEMTVRLAWERVTGKRLLMCVLLGTTNKQAYLQDTTGNRRYLPIIVHPRYCETNRIDKNRLKEEMPQIRAEALHEYRRLTELGPINLNLSPAAITIQRQLCAAAMVATDADGILGRIEEILMTPVQMIPQDAEVGDSHMYFVADGAVYRRFWFRDMLLDGLETSGYDIKHLRGTRARGNDFATAIEQLSWLGDKGKKMVMPDARKYGRQRVLEIDPEAFADALARRDADETEADEAPEEEIVLRF